METNYQRITKLVAKKEESLVYAHDKGITVTNDIYRFDDVVSKYGLDAIIGVYDKTCPEEWIEDDLDEAGHKHSWR